MKRLQLFIYLFVFVIAYKEDGNGETRKNDSR